MSPSALMIRHRRAKSIAPPIAAPRRQRRGSLLLVLALLVVLSEAVGSISQATEFDEFSTAGISPPQNGDPWMQLSQSATPTVIPATFQPEADELQHDDQWTPPPAATQPHCLGDYSADNCHGEQWHSQVLPQGIIYQSYMAGAKEPRFATFFNQNSKMGDMWDVTLGARAGIWRYGNDDPNWPEGWQLDLEGGVFPRLDPNGPSTPLYASDYRFGIPLTYGGDRWEFKIAYYHISAHLGDEYLLYVNPAANRINFVRDGLALGAGYFLTPAFRLYGEMGYAAVDGGAKPLEFQFGFDWAQAHDTGIRGGPFLAINGNLRQEVDYGGDVVVQFGWMWRKCARGSNFRIGGQYFYGKSDQFEFFHLTESRLGWGLWYDF
jgi:hypothetical protein